MISLKKEIENADMVVVGIGAELQAKNLIPYQAKEIAQFYQELGMTKYEEICAHANEEEFTYIKDLYYFYYIVTQKIPTIYDRLEKILAGKNFFIITSNTDDLIYSSTLDETKIVAPCGTRRYFQCSKGCEKNLYPAKELMFAKLKEFEETGETSKIGCGLCKAPLEFNIRIKDTADHYVEEGYLSQWGKYTKWLQGTLNKRFLVLELGEGFEQPNLFRWPFERLVYLNQKAKLIRVHSKLSQIGEDLKERAVSVPMSAIDFLMEQELDDKNEVKNC